MTDGAPAIDPRLVERLAHPLRLEILRLLNRHEASPNEIAGELGEPLGNVSYHVRMLHKFDCVELVRTTPRRGAVEHFYRGKRRESFTRGEWHGLSGEARRAMNDVILRTIWSELQESMDSGVFNARPESQVSRLALTLDEQGWEELSAVLAELEQRVAELEDASTERRAASGEQGLTARCALMQFEAAPPRTGGAGGSPPAGSAPAGGRSGRQAEAKPPRQGVIATMRSIGTRARAASAASTFTWGARSRRASCSFGSVIIFM